MRKTKQITITIDSELYDLLLKHTEEECRSVSGFINLLIKKFFS